MGGIPVNSVVITPEMIDADYSTLRTSSGWYVGALVHMMPPKPHEDMKLGKSKNPGERGQDQPRSRAPRKKGCSKQS